MKPADLRAWYDGQSARDQRVLRIGGIAVGLILLVWLLLPLHRSLVAARADLQRKQEDLAWMTQVGPTLAAAGPGAAMQPVNESIVVLVQRTAEESGLGQAITASQPSGAGGLRVQLENADFNLVVGWLSRLGNQHGVQAESASVTGTSSAGMVNVSVQLRSAAAR